MASVRRSSHWYALLLAAGMVAGCVTRTTDADRSKADTRFDENKSLFAAIRDAGETVVYEGLPPVLRTTAG